MNNNRHATSFAITSTLYLIGGMIFVWLTDIPQVIPKVTQEVIKVAVIIPPKPIVTPQPTHIPIPIPPKPKVKQPKKVEPKPKPTPQLKPRLKPKPKPTPKPVVKPKPVEKKVVKPPLPKPQPKAVVHERITEPVIHEEPEVVMAPEPVARQLPKRIETVQTASPPPPKVDLNAQKRAFLKNVRNTIYAHKEYPTLAKRRNIQGTVHVMFDILENGQIDHVHTEGGSKILQKAARKSLMQSVPFPVPPVLSGHFPIPNVSINIDFKLQ